MALGKIGDFAKRVVDKAKDKGKSALDRGTALLKTHPGYLATTGIVNFASGLTSGEGLIGAFQSAAGDAWDTYQSGVNAGFLMPYETEQLDESSDGTSTIGTTAPSTLDPISAYDSTSASANRRRRAAAGARGSTLLTGSLGDSTLLTAGARDRLG